MALYYFLQDTTSPASPIYQAISLIAPYAMGAIALLCTIYGIVLGVKMAKAEDAEAKKKVQKTLINFVIGWVSIFVLLLILYAIRDYV